MADVVGRELYDGAYAELSDWEHWGGSGTGESIARQNDCIIVHSNSDRIAGLALLGALSAFVLPIWIPLTGLSR
jgi:hypothetical protein